MVYACPYFIKHVPVADRAALLCSRLGRSIFNMASDYTAYEKHFTQLVYLVEMLLYKHMLQRVPQAKWIVQMIDAILRGINTCFFKFLTAEIPAGRMSGEMNTSLGNGFMNLMLYLFLNRYSGNTYCDALVEGDDLIGSHNGKKLLADDYRRLGFTIKIEYFERVHEASFCGLIYDPEDLVSIPDPHKVLLNVGWTSARYLNSSDKTRRQLLRAKGLSMLYQYAGSPIIQSLAQYIIRLTDGLRYKFPGEWTNWQKTHFKSDAVAKPVGFRTRMLMEKHFRYSVSEQYILEKYFDETQVLQPMDMPILKSHFTRDQRTYWRRFVTTKIPDPRKPWVHAVNRTTAWKKAEVEKMESNHGDTIHHVDSKVNSQFVLSGL